MKKRRFACLVVVCLFVAAPLFARQDPNYWCGSKGPAMTEYQLKLHDAHEQELSRQPFAAGIQPAGYDAGEIAVMRTDAKTLVQPNPFDLVGRKIVFTRNTAPAGYNVRLIYGTLSANVGTALPLGDDDGKQIVFNNGFSFPFYGTTYTSVFVNTDGNLTFKRRDIASTDRDVSRILSGPPRIAPFFYDLNPENAGTIYVLQTATKLSVTWQGVSEWMYPGSSNSNTFQVNLFKNGRIEFVYAGIQTKGPIVGISPGATNFSNAQLVNYTATPTMTAVTKTILERFATTLEVDFVALLNEFHATHQPIVDFVAVYSEFNFSLGPSAFAYFVNIQNNTTGIGLPTFNYSSMFGSPKIRGYLAMGWLPKFPADPNQPIPRARGGSHVRIIGHETAHCWLAYPLIIENGTKTDDLLGYQDAHWNFYMDADASLMEGNNVVDNGNGSFTTTAFDQIYSRLDLYLMGIIPLGGVPPRFFVTGPTDKATLVPTQTGVTFSGTRVNFAGSDIVSANGPRVPNSGTSPKTFRLAFILLTRNATADPANVSKLDRLRLAYQAWFKQMTLNKGTLNTTLP